MARFSLNIEETHLGGGSMMHSRLFIGGCSLAFLAVLLLLPAQGRSQDLPEGVNVVVISEVDVDSPGIEKVLLMKVTMQPGKAWEDVPLDNLEFCHLTEGSYTVVVHDLGITNTYTVGARWFNRKGWTISLYNKGDVPAVQWVYQIVEKK